MVVVIVVVIMVVIMVMEVVRGDGGGNNGWAWEFFARLGSPSFNCQQLGRGECNKVETKINIYLLTNQIIQRQFFLFRALKGKNMQDAVKCQIKSKTQFKWYLNAYIASLTLFIQ